MFHRKLGKGHAPEFPPRLTWLNSKALKMKSLLGKVVMVEFWTYSCVNCVRTMPHITKWQKQYGEKGLVIIGVHTPEFAFEKEAENVERAMKEFGIEFPVVLDSEYKIWNLYANRWWPRTFLIDHTGAIVYDHVGEGGYAKTESMIQKLLMETGASDMPAIPPDMSVGGGLCYRTTPELYLGYVRGRFGNGHANAAHTEEGFTAPAGNFDADVAYIHGHWQMMKDRLVHTRKLPSATEFVAVNYSAFSVNMVMGSTYAKGGKVYLELDGQPLPEDMAGEDVKVGKDGKAYVRVNEHRMYRLIDSDAYHRGVLKLKTAEKGVEFFALTFGGCKGE